MSLSQNEATRGEKFKIWRRVCRVWLNPKEIYRLCKPSFKVTGERKLTLLSCLFLETSPCKFTGVFLLVTCVNLPVVVSGQLSWNKTTAHAVMLAVNKASGCRILPQSQKQPLVNCDRMTSPDREKFFRQRVLSKLFPSEEESDSEGDEDTTEQLHSPVGTESEDLNDVVSKGQKRKLGEHDGHQSLAPSNDVSLQNEENTPSYSSHQLHAVERPVLFSSPRSLQDLSAAHEISHESSAKECEDQAAQDTGSQPLTESAEPASKLSKNQKRKLKKKRHKERVRSNRDKQTTSAPKEFTYETG